MATKYQRKAADAAGRIMQAFQTGDLPKALAPVFIHRADDVPCRSWSWNNQLLAALSGTSDARGFRQWQEVGHCVKKGEKAFPILVPLKGKRKGVDPETGEERDVHFIYGFSSAPVFGIEQTGGDPLPPPDPAVMAWLDSLPLRGVAEAWGLTKPPLAELPKDAVSGQRCRVGTKMPCRDKDAVSGHSLPDLRSPRNLTDSFVNWQSGGGG